MIRSTWSCHRMVPTSTSGRTPLAARPQSQRLRLRHRGRRLADGVELHLPDRKSALCPGPGSAAAIISVAISPDGSTVYAGSNTTGVVATLDRDPVDGELTQDAGMDGCIANNGRRRVAQPAADCRPSAWRSAPTAEMSTSGPRVTRWQSWIAIPAATSTQRPSPGVDDCWTELAFAGCSNGRGLSDATAFAFDPDGEFMYVASDQSRAIAVFDRTFDDTADSGLKSRSTTRKSRTGPGGIVGVSITNDGPTHADDLEVELTPSGSVRVRPVVQCDQLQRGGGDDDVQRGARLRIGGVRDNGHLLDLPGGKGRGDGRLRCHGLEPGHRSQPRE